jgi:hypothetical protein
MVTSRVPGRRLRRHRKLTVRVSASYCTQVALNADLVALPKRKFTARGVTASTRVEGKYNDSGGRLTAGPPTNSASLTGVQLRSCGSSDTSSVRADYST